MALKNKQKVEKPTTDSFAFSKVNYQWLIAAIVTVLVGFILMIGKSDIYSFTKITLAPFIIVLGFALGVVSILKKPKTNS